MTTTLEVNELMERMRNDDADHEGIAWGDMNTALREGQCYHCVNIQDKIDND